MRILLDTQALLWFYSGDARLSINARQLIADSANTKLVSPASYWELAIKVSMGKYCFSESYSDFIQHAILDNGFEILPITVRHSTCLASLAFPKGHKDPFDRLLIAQAIVERISIVSVDGQFDLYPITRLW